MIGRTPEEQAYLDAWVDLANMPSLSERSAEQEVAAQHAEHRLREAERTHLDACLAAHPERQTELDACLERAREAEAAAEADAEQEIEDPEAEIG